MWTAARSSFGAVALALVAVAVVAMVRRSARPGVVSLVVAVCFAGVAVVPLVTRDPLAFTNRGLIWDYSLRFWRTSEVVGLGSAWYDRIGSTADRLAGSVVHGHNEFVQLLVTGGLVLLVLVAAQLILVSVRCGRLAAVGYLAGVGFVAALAGSSLLEITLVLVDNTSLFPVVVLPLAILVFGTLPPPVDRGRALPAT